MVNLLLSCVRIENLTRIDSNKVGHMAFCNCA